MENLYCFRTFTTQAEADAAAAFLARNYRGSLVVEWSDFVERFTLKADAADVRALYVRLQSSEHHVPEVM
jgi:hypothetical protein